MWLVLFQMARCSKRQAEDRCALQVMSFTTSDMFCLQVFQQETGFLFSYGVYRPLARPKKMLNGAPLQFSSSFTLRRTNTIDQTSKRPRVSVIRLRRQHQLTLILSMLAFNLFSSLILTDHWMATATSTGGWCSPLIICQLRRSWS